MKFCKLEKQFEYKGHECLVIFNHFGYRCGYVSTSLTDDYTNLDIDCHCGLTFSGARKETIPEAKCNNYIGFDCGHCWDGVDIKQAYEYGLLNEKEYESRKDWALNDSYPVCSIEYVEENCKKIVEQLIELEKVAE